MSGRDLWISIVMGVLAARAAVAAGAPADPRPGILQVVREYAAAVNRGDPKALLALYASRRDISAIKLGDLLRGREALREEAETLAGTGGSQKMQLGTADIVLLGQQHALVVVPVTLEITADDEQEQYEGAASFVLVQESGKWRILHEHHSFLIPDEEDEGEEGPDRDPRP